MAAAKVAALRLPGARKMKRRRPNGAAAAGISVSTAKGLSRTKAPMTAAMTAAAEAEAAAAIRKAVRRRKKPLRSSLPSAAVRRWAAAAGQR